MSVRLGVRVVMLWHVCVCITFALVAAMTVKPLRIKVTAAKDHKATE